jgi:hypothetical protein
VTISPHSIPPPLIRPTCSPLIPLVNLAAAHVWLHRKPLAHPACARPSRLRPPLASSSYQLEHRFYGKSQPFQNLSLGSLGYLSSKQALADAAHFVAYGVRAWHGKDTKVVSFGGSYSGERRISRLNPPGIHQSRCWMRGCVRGCEASGGWGGLWGFLWSGWGAMFLVCLQHSHRRTFGVAPRALPRSYPRGNLGVCTSARTAKLQGVRNIFDLRETTTSLSSCFAQIKGWGTRCLSRICHYLVHTLYSRRSFKQVQPHSEVSTTFRCFDHIPKFRLRSI